MTFDDLLNQPYPELELLQIVAERIFANFQTQSKCYCLKIEKVDAARSKIVWVESFAERADFTDFSFSFKYLQARIAVVRKKKHYAIILRGFTISAFIHVFIDRIEKLPTFKQVGDPESHLMPPRELIEKGFADLGMQFRAKAKRSA